jgi:hypothetical protein
VDADFCVRAVFGVAAGESGEDVSIQIQIAQSAKDEVDFAEYLRSIGIDRFHEKFFPRGVWQPRESWESRDDVSELDDQVLCFRSTDLKAVESMIKPAIAPDPVDLVSDYLRITVEWSLTRRNSCHGYFPGRVYWGNPTGAYHHAPGAIEVRKLVTKITSQIKKTFPLRTDHKHPTYVGPELARLVEEGTAHVAFGNGTVMKFGANPRLKKPASGRKVKRRSVD